MRNIEVQAITKCVTTYSIRVYPVGSTKDSLGNIILSYSSLMVIMTRKFQSYWKEKLLFFTTSHQLLCYKPQKVTCLWVAFFCHYMGPSLWRTQTPIHNILGSVSLWFRIGQELIGDRDCVDVSIIHAHPCALIQFSCKQIE